MADNITGRDFSNASVTLATKEIAAGVHAGKVVLVDPTTPANIQAVSASGAASVSQVDITSTGAIAAAAQTVAIVLNGQSAASIQITGVWVGTLQFEGTTDGTTWSAVNGVFAGISTPGPTITANGLVRLTPGGLAQLRINATAWTSGTATITIRASAATGGTFLNQSLTTGTNIIGKVGIDQTTPGTTNRVDVGTINSVAPAFGTGVRGATVQRVTISTDDVVPVTGTFFQATQPISAAALPLPTGAATSAKQPALGTAGVASTDVITVQGIASGVAQPVSQATPANLQMSATQVVGSAATRWFAQISDGTTSPAIKAASTAAATADSSIVVAMAGANSATKIGDGTNNAAIKAASTAAVVTDPALTVAISPNNSVAVTQATAANLNATVAQGTAAAIGNSWYAKLSDGTTGPVAVKAASTAAAFTDIALTADVRPGGALVTASAALADALANPTLGKQAMLSHVYNGTTWDLQRGMGGNATTGDTGAKTATGNGATITNVGNKGIQIVLNMGAVTGTTPTFVMKVQGSVDGGTNFFDIPGAITASLVATGIWGITIYPGAAVTAGTTTTGTTAGASGVIPRTWRVVWTVGGTTPSFTITSISYNYIPN